MQMHLSIEEEGKKKVGSKEEFSLASSKVKVLLPFASHSHYG
jgi:hypothetical protein